MNTCLLDTFATPLGAFTVAVDAHGAVVATAFGDDTQLGRRLTGCKFVRDPARTATARRELQEYFAGERTAFNLPLAPAGSAFQHRVWTAVRGIPFGVTRTYGEIAAQLGVPGSARAVGRANATNPVCVIVPCHRVVGTGGSLTGFAFGVELKRRLLELERTGARVAA